MKDFMHAHMGELIAIAPRPEPLETSIEVQTVQEPDYFGNPYTHKKIVE